MPKYQDEAIKLSEPSNTRDHRMAGLGFLINTWIMFPNEMD